MSGVNLKKKKETPHTLYKIVLLKGMQTQLILLVVKAIIMAIIY